MQNCGLFCISNVKNGFTFAFREFESAPGPDERRKITASFAQNLTIQIKFCQEVSRKIFSQICKFNKIYI